MSRLQNLRMKDEVLTEHAIGYKNATFIADALFPIVMVEKERVLIPKFGKESFKLYNTERAPRASTNVMKPENIDTIALVTKEHDLSYPMDYREKAESLLNLEIRATNAVTAIIQLKREKAAADLAQTLANFPTGHKVTLASDAKWSNKTGANSSPIDHVKTARAKIREKIGQYPNTMALGATAYEALQNHPELIEKIKYSMKGILTLDLLKEIFEIENIVVGKAVYSNDSNVFGDLWTDNAILAYVPPVSRDIEEPSFGYTPRRTGNPFVDKYLGDGGKVEYVRNTDNFGVQIVGSEAGYIINDVVA